jgi:ribosome maturation factor RimP
VGDELQDVVAPVVENLGLELVDVELRPGVVRVVVDRQGGVDLDSISGATREISSVLDRNDPMPGGRYTLEVSSPGLERPLKTPAQFSRAVGEQVTLRTIASAGLERRLRGTLESADDEGVVLTGEGLPVEGSRIAYADIERARTVFEWGAAS